MSASDVDLLALTEVCVSYGPLPAIRSVSLRLRAGEIVALIGPNGAGKTTLLKAIAGELRLAGGRIAMEGQDLKGSTFRRAQHGIAYVPEGHRTITSLNVAQNLVVSAHAVGVRRRSPVFAERAERVYALFPALHDRRGVGAGQLSGGEQQMLAIGCALMSRPKVLLVDELSLGLAPLAVDRLLTAVETLPADGTAVLLVEQFADRALQVSNRGYLLSEGVVAAEGDSGELAKSDAIEAVFLG